MTEASAPSTVTIEVSADELPVVERALAEHRKPPKPPSLADYVLAALIDDHPDGGTNDQIAASVAPVLGEENDSPFRQKIARYVQSLLRGEHVVKDRTDDGVVYAVTDQGRQRRAARLPKGHPAP